MVFGADQGNRGFRGGTRRDQNLAEGGKPVRLNRLHSDYGQIVNRLSESFTWDAWLLGGHYGSTFARAPE